MRDRVLKYRIMAFVIGVFVLSSALRVGAVEEKEGLTAPAAEAAEEKEELTVPAAEAAEEKEELTAPAAEATEEKEELTAPAAEATEEKEELTVPAAEAVEEKEELTAPTVETIDRNILSVDLPVVNEDEPSPFDFFIDPQGLLYATGAAKYGGGNVEEGATLLFQNREGEYDFSSHSDILTIGNRSKVPVKVILNAEIEISGGVHLVTESQFEGTNTNLYLAVVDDQGNEVPVTEGEAVSLEWELKAGEDYSFGLTGACNQNWEWTQEENRVVIRLTWKVEGIDTKNEDAAAPKTETLPTKLPEGTEGDLDPEKDGAETGQETSGTEDKNADERGTGNENTEESVNGNENRDESGTEDESTEESVNGNENRDESGTGDESTEKSGTGDENTEESGNEDETTDESGNGDGNTTTVSGGDL